MKKNRIQQLMEDLGLLEKPTPNHDANYTKSSSTTNKVYRRSSGVNKSHYDKGDEIRLEVDEVSNTSSSSTDVPALDSVDEISSIGTISDAFPGDETFTSIQPNESISTEEFQVTNDPMPMVDATPVSNQDDESVNFEEDLKRILTGDVEAAREKLAEYEEKQGATPAPKPKPQPKSKSQSTDKNSSGKKDPHSIFERMAEGMEYATTFDMGTVHVASQLFDDFDKQMDLEEGKSDSPAPMPLAMTNNYAYSWLGDIEEKQIPLRGGVSGGGIYDGSSVRRGLKLKWQNKNGAPQENLLKPESNSSVQVFSDQLLPSLEDVTAVKLELGGHYFLDVAGMFGTENKETPHKKSIDLEIAKNEDLTATLSFTGRNNGNAIIESVQTLFGGWNTTDGGYYGPYHSIFKAYLIQTENGYLIHARMDLVQTKGQLKILDAESTDSSTTVTTTLKSYFGVEADGKVTLLVKLVGDDLLEIIPKNPKGRVEPVRGSISELTNGMLKGAIAKSPYGRVALFVIELLKNLELELKASIQTAIGMFIGSSIESINSFHKRFTKNYFKEDVIQNEYPQDFTIHFYNRIGVGAKRIFSVQGFETGKFELSDEQERSLKNQWNGIPNDFKKKIKEGKVSVELTGSASNLDFRNDSNGEKNKELARKRAMSIFSYLTSSDVMGNDVDRRILNGLASNPEIIDDYSAFPQDDNSTAHRYAQVVFKVTN